MTTHRIPSSLGGEAVGVATRVAPGRDVVERRCTRRVQEGVEEPEGALAGLLELVVEERDHAREDRARARRAVHEAELARDRDLDVLALRGDVRERAPAGVELARVGAAERGEVGRDDGGLVRWPGEDVREAARREGGRRLGDAGRRTNRGQAGVGSALLRSPLGRLDSQGATRREGRNESRAALALRAGDTTVTRREEDGRAASTELHVCVAQVAEGQDR